MTQIYQQAGRVQRERSRWFGIRCGQRVRRAICVFVGLAFLSSLAMAQSTSQLNGSVTDPSGASVAGAKITLTNPATGFQRETTSNAAGL
ncbi:MAG: carboxypeptidase-like regulatory domain-containing protein, partial [Candidatus Sulfotelmatobacter sp.]